MKNNHFHQPKVMSWVLSSVLLFSGCQFRSDSKNTANDFLSIHNQIETKWEELGPDILAKAIGNSDQKVFIEPALLAAIVEAEPMQDKTSIKNTLYQKTQALRKAIENPANQNNLLSILSQYYLEVHEPQNIKVLSYWSANKKYMPNVFVYQRDHLPYQDKTLTSKEKELGLTAMAYLPLHSPGYLFVNKALVNFKNYLARQNDFKGFDWIKNKIIYSVLNSQRAAFSIQSVLALKGPQNIPKGIYADLYQKLVLLGVVSQYEKPSVALLMKAVMNSHFFVKEPATVKQALQTGDLSLVLSEVSARQLILYCDETIQQWRDAQHFFEQLKKLFPEDKRELIKNFPLYTESNRDELVKMFIDEFNREAKKINIPSFYAHIGLPENYPMNELFYTKLKKVVDRYEQLSGPYGVPLKGQITSGFGWRRDPLLKEIKHHGGIDIAGFLGTPLRAVMAGTAHVHYGHDDFGNYVVIKNDRTGEEVIYAHCQKILVSEGAKISNGDIVALLGATGRVTGPHLHIERHLKGQPVPFINMDRKDLMVLSALQDFVLFLAQVCLAE